ncbi:MAG: hypothetical protein QOI12_2245 [Alphaproteobacteria bacterium]|jgi:hypothetical protein|nr:hypothetical protein [Alphaproteobacteria bacterium]
MNHATILMAAALALAATLRAAPAQALNARSFVSGHGSDANNCTLPLPCRTLQAAHDKTDAGGEIDILDPAGYGALTISKAISIVNDGVGTAAILVPAGLVGITINAGLSDVVSLRGLTIEGGGSGQSGIVFNAGASLTIDNCVIRRVGNNGINFLPNAPSNLAISNTLVADNGSIGILVFPSGSDVVTAVFNRVEANNNVNHGIRVDGTNSTGIVNATASDSVAARNGDKGFLAYSFPSQAPTTLTLFHSVAANNASGIVAFGSGATIRAAQSMVTGNTSAGWSAIGGGVVESYGDNYIDGNGTNGGALTPIVKQ